AQPYWIRATPVPPVNASLPWRNVGGAPVNAPPETVSTSNGLLKVSAPLLLTEPAVWRKSTPQPDSAASVFPAAMSIVPELRHVGSTPLPNIRSQLLTVTVPVLVTSPAIVEYPSFC